MSWLTAVVVVLAVTPITTASHFRGGIIMARHMTGSTNSELSFHMSWRRSTGSSYFCDSTTIANGNLLAGGSLRCISGCSGTITSLSFMCTDFSAAEDWTFGGRTVNYDITAITSANVVTIGFTGCCWISGFGSWSLTTRLSLTTRSDIGRINSTPRAVTSPVIRLQSGCTHSIPIAVSDSDGDTVRCRWASGSTECGGICSAFPGATLNSATCTISYTANRGTGYKAAAIVIEDFASGYSGALSSVGLQFLVLVVSGGSCSQQPTFVSPTLSQGTCVPVPPTTTFTTQLRASSGSTSVAITAIQTTSPSGTSKGALQHISGTSNYYVLISWTPQSSQYGQTYFLCYTALNSFGISSSQICISLSVRSPPTIVSGTNTPNQQLVQPSNTTWHARFNRAIQRPSTSAYITFHNNETNQQVYQIDTLTSLELSFLPSNEIAIKPNYVFAEKQTFYIQFSSGAIRAADGCMVDSTPVVDKSFWVFETISTVVDCGTPEISSNGDIPANLSYNSTLFNSTVSYTCGVGYDIHGNTSRVCLASGEWSEMPPECLIVTCGSLVVTIGAPGGLTVSYTDTVYNSTATYSCTQIGYELIGTPERVCEDSGSWSYVEPSCQLISCGTPDVALGNGTLLTATFTSTTYSSVASYTCAIGYNLIGLPQRICQSNKQWSGNSPFCQIVNCGSISVPPNSLGGLSVVFSDTTFNSTATYSCPLLGFVLIGAAERECEADGNWTSSVPHCEIVPLNFTAFARDATTIDLAWIIPPSATTVVNHYIIEITSQVNSQVTSYFSIETQALVIGLHPHYSYSCRVAVFTTSRHPYTSTIHVQLPQAAPTSSPQTPGLVVLSSRSLNVTWFPPSPVHQNGVITKYLIKVVEEHTSIETQYNTSTTWLLLPNLRPHYLYTFMFAAVTVAVGPFGSTKSVRMPEDAPTGSPLNLLLLGVDASTISISWQPPLFEKQNGIIRKYIVAVTEIETSKNFTLVSYNTSTTIYSLHSYYNYQVSVSAFTIATGPSSQHITVQTAQSAPSGPVTSITGYADSAYSVFLTWNPPPDDEHNGILTGYVVNVTVLENNGSFSLLTKNSSLVLDTLKPFRTYTFAIAPMTVVGFGPTGVLFTIKTPQTAPTGAPSIASTSYSSRHIAINWNPPDYEEQNGNITHYVLNVTELQTGVSTVYTSTSLSISVPNLHPAYTYQCIIAAFTVGLGPFTIPFNITTQEEAPSSGPASLLGSTLSPTAAVFTWTPPPAEDQNGVIVMYFVNLTLLGGGLAQQYTTSNTSIVVSNLLPYRYYTCIIAAATKVGTGPYSIIFTIQTPQAAPSSSPMITEASIVNSRTVLMQWSPPPPEDHNGVITKYTVNITSQNTASYQQINVTGTSAVITNLVASFTYYLSVSAHTVDTGPYSSYVVITLPQDVPTGFPRNVEGNSPSPTSIVLKWTPPTLEEQSGEILQYIVNVTHAGTLETTQHFTNTTNITIASLQPYTTYVCFIAARTAIGIGPFSLIFFIQTEEGVPSNSPEHLGGVPVGPTSIHLTWDPPPLEHHNGEIDGYLVNVTEITTGHFMQHFSNQTQITIENLHPFYAYHCQVTAVTVGEGPYTDVVIVVTDESAPSTSPFLTYVAVLGPTSIALSWSPPGPPSAVNGIIREYSVTVENVNLAEVETYIAFGTSINITNLHPYTEYSCRVAAVTVAMGPLSLPVNITTDQDAPSSSPEQFTATATSRSVMLLLWNPPAFDSINGIVQHYVVTVLEQETGNTTQSTTTNANYTMTGLHPYYTYMCSVSAVTVANGPQAFVTIQMPEDAPNSAPANVAVVTVSSTVIQVSWDPLAYEDRNGIIRHYTVQVNEQQTGLTILTNSTTESHSLSHLHPAYTYIISVAAVTVERGPFSSTITATTEEDVPSSPPTNLAVIVQNSTAALISWSPPPQTDHNGIITTYTVTLVNKKTDLQIKYNTLATSLIVDTLSPFTNYELAVTANTSVGMGPQSAFLPFLTNEAAPSAAPNDFNVETPTSTSLLLSWTPPPEDSQNGIIRSYIVNITRVDVVNDVMVYSTTVPSLILGGLEPFTSYQCSVAAVTINQGPFTISVVVQTLEDAPSSAPVVNVTVVDSTTVFIDWEPPLPHETNGIITGYTVNVSVTETQTQIQYLVSNTTELVLTELHPYYTYTVIVSASTIKPGPFSMEHTVVTLPAAPTGPPQNITADIINATSIELSWQLPQSEHQNGMVLSYFITVFELESNSTTVTHQYYLQNSIVISFLHPFYHYKLSVAAYTMALGPYGDTTVLTDQYAPTSPPMNVSITIVTSTSVTLHWSPPPADQHNGIIQHYTLQLSEHNTGVVSQYTSTGLHYTINGLHPHYTYTCTVAAVTVDVGPTQSTVFQMPQDAPSDAPTSVQGIPLNETTLFMLWQAPQSHHHNGIITAYHVLLREVQTDSTALHVLTSNTTSTVISDLHPSYQYEVQVAAVTVAIGPYSDTAVIQLPESAPSGYPLQVTASSMSPTTILITWSPPPISMHNGVLTGYVIRATAIDSQMVIQLTLGSSVNNYTISSLNPFSNYLCTVATKTSAGLGPYSPGEVIQTLQSAPGSPPLHFGGVALNSTSIHLTWDQPHPMQQNGIIQFYLINLTELESGMQSQYTINQTQITIYNLYPFYTYAVSVAAVTVSMGPHTEIVTVTTHQESPSGPPMNLTFTASSSTTATLQWSPPLADQQNGIIQHYALQLTEHKSGELLEHTTNGLQYTFNGLHPHYTYTCTVAAVTIGVGPVQPIVFQMPQDAPSGVPYNVSVMFLNATALFLRWLPPAPEQQNGIIVQYTITVTELSTSTSIDIVSTSNKTDTVVSDLHPFYQYDIQVAAGTILTGPPSDFISIQMPESVPNSSPKNFFYDATMNLSTVVWTPPPVRDHNGVILGYNLSCVSDRGDSLTVLVEGTTATVNNLVNDSHYTCSVCAYTFPGCGPPAVIYISTYDESPVGPPKVSLLNTSTTWVQITWNPPFNPENFTLGFGLTYQLFNSSLLVSTPRPKTTITNIDSYQTTFTLRPLLQGSRYRIVMYTITAQGTSPQSDQLLVTTQHSDPNGPRNFICNSTSPNSFTCTWNSPNANDWSTVRYELSYGLLEKFDYYPGYGEPFEVINLPGMTEQHSIVSLPPYGGYLLELKAFMIKNGTGGVPSLERVQAVSTIAFTAEQVPEAASVRNFNITVVSPTSLSLSWLPPERVHWLGVVLYYEVSVVSLGSLGAAEMTRSTVELKAQVEPKDNHKDPSLASEPLQPESHIVGGLEEYHQYSVSIVMVNSAGEGEPTQPIVQNMPEAKPSGPPVEVKATNITPHSITILWQPPVILDANGVIVGYMLKITVSSSREKTRTVELTRPFYTISELMPYQQVIVSVAAETKEGLGPFSENVTFQTTVLLPRAPRMLTGINNGQAVILSWRPPDQPNGVIMGYQVFYSGYATPYQGADSLADGMLLTTEETVNIQNLQPGLYYIFKVQAWNSAGFGANATTAFISIAGERVVGSSMELTAITISVPLVVAVVIVALIFIIAAICLVTYQRKRKIYTLQSRPTDDAGMLNRYELTLQHSELSKDMVPLTDLPTHSENVYAMRPAKESPEQPRKLQARDKSLLLIPTEEKVRRPTVPVSDVVIENEMQCEVFSADSKTDSECIYEEVDDKAVEPTVVQKEKTEETINVAGDESEEKSNSEESKLTFL